MSDDVLLPPADEPNPQLTQPELLETLLDGQPVAAAARAPAATFIFFTVMLDMLALGMIAPALPWLFLARDLGADGGADWGWWLRGRWGWRGEVCPVQLRVFSREFRVGFSSLRVWYELGQRLRLVEVRPMSCQAHRIIRHESFWPDP